MKIGLDTVPPIPDEYMSSFIRGCWDGDRAVMHRKTKSGSLAYRTSFVSSNKYFASHLKQFFENTLKLPTHKLYYSKNTYNLDYGHAASKILLDYLYSDDGFKMNRKYDKYMELN